MRNEVKTLEMLVMQIRTGELFERAVDKPDELAELNAALRRCGCGPCGQSGGGPRGDAPEPAARPDVRALGGIVQSVAGLVGACSPAQFGQLLDRIARVVALPFGSWDEECSAHDKDGSFLRIAPEQANALHIRIGHLRQTVRRAP